MSDFEDKIQAILPTGIRFFSVLDKKYGTRYILSVELSNKAQFWQDELFQMRDPEGFITEKAIAMAIAIKVAAVELCNEAKALKGDDA